MTDPVRQPDDLEAVAAAFWVDADLEARLASTPPSESPDSFAIDELTDDEWNRFVAALDA